MPFIFNPFTGQFDFTGSGGVTDVSFTGGLISVANPTTAPAFTVAGTSGGIPYFSGAATWASSAVLAANSLVKGGGAGVAPSTITTGTGILAALGINVNSTGAPVLFNGALGTPSGGTLTNATGLPLATGITGISAGVLSTLTLPNTNTTITGGGTIALGGFTLTLPATGTAALLATANVFTAGQTIARGTTAVSAPWLTASQTWNASGITFRGHEVIVTETAAAAGSTFLRILGGAGGSTERFSFQRNSSGLALLAINGLVASDNSVALAVSGKFRCDSDISTFGNILVNAGYYSATGGNLLFAGSQTVLNCVNQFNLGSDSATPVAQTFGSTRGLGTNITGGALNIGTPGTGTGTGGRVNLQYHAAGASSSTLGILVNVLSVVGVGTIRITSIPTSSAGLSTGDVYSNAGILTIVP